MVTSISSLSRSGLSDFVIQRVSAAILTLYALCVLGFFLANPDLDYATLRNYFASVPMLLFSTLMVLSTAAHAWIGMWTVGTDYIRDHYFGKHSTAFRMVYQAGCLLILFVYVVWALQMFWTL
ncbi:MAG: succinate dehydrogenase, hydrophobic membrane anchor protein [Pseudomonadales bacterium]|jgi:succinate dehydrogenase / fumarate reductase membrane anchor subunit